MQKYFAVDGSLIREVGNNNSIRVLPAQEKWLNDVNYQELHSDILLSISEPLHEVDDDAQKNIVSTIFQDEISPRVKLNMVLINWGEDKEPMKKSINLAITWKPGTIEFRTIKEYKGENLLDNYYNLVNTAFHEDGHSSDGVSNDPFDHFDLGVKQFKHQSFEKTTPNFKSFFRMVMGNY